MFSTFIYEGCLSAGTLCRMILILIWAHEQLLAGNRALRSMIVAPSFDRRNVRAGLASPYVPRAVEMSSGVFGSFLLASRWGYQTQAS